MIKEIDIQVERQNHGDWIKIFIPYPSDEKMLAVLQNEYGETIKRVKLTGGNNSIDISNITTASVNIKIETASETILKKLNFRL